MKVAIYGDSWADPRNGHYLYPELSQTAWPNLLAQRGWSVDNYSRSGSSLHYSYQKFLATHADYERVIFIVTTMGRWTRHFTLHDGTEGFVNSYHTAEFLLNKDTTRRSIRTEDKHLLEHLKNYYLWVQDMSFERTAQELMVQEIQRIRPDAILIPIAQRVGLDLDLTPMVAYQELFVRSCWPDRPDLVGAQHHLTWEETACVCHMTPEINKVVCESMRAALVLGKWDPIIPDRVEHEHPGSYYVKLFKD